MYIDNDENVQMQLTKDRLWVNTPRGCVVRIQGLAKGHCVVNTGINEKEDSMVDIFIFPKYTPPTTISSRIRSFFVRVVNTVRVLIVA